MSENRPYGLCPKCGAHGVSRERRPDGNDTCANGCVYPSKDSIPLQAEANDGEGEFVITTAGEQALLEYECQQRKGGLSRFFNAPLVEHTDKAYAYARPEVPK